MQYLLLLLLWPVVSLAAPQVRIENLDDMVPAIEPDDDDLVPGDTLDGVRLDMIPAMPAVAEIVAEALPEEDWTVSCDSAQAGNDCSNAIDGNADTFWLSDAGASLPQSIVIDMQTPRIVGNVSILPRSDGSSDGNIGQHQIFLRYVLSRDLLVWHLTSEQRKSRRFRFASGRWNLL